MEHQIKLQTWIQCILPTRSFNRRCMDNPQSPSVRCWALTGGWDYAKPYLGSLRWELKGDTQTHTSHKSGCLAPIGWTVDTYAYTYLYVRIYIYIYLCIYIYTHLFLQSEYVSNMHRLYTFSLSLYKVVLDIIHSLFYFSTSCDSTKIPSFSQPSANLVPAKFTEVWWSLARRWCHLLSGLDPWSRSGGKSC